MEQLTINEKKVQRRKDLIKNILIVFLVVMLLLTFFSGTIRNWSLPEVATSRVQSASVSPQVRLTGTVEADDPYNIVLKETRKVASVAVKKGDEVKKDDPIYYLEDTESTELEEAEKELRKMETDFELSLFQEEVADSTIARVRSGQVDSIDGYQAQMKNINDRFEAATEADKAVQAQIDALETEHKKKLSEIGEVDTSALEYANADVDAEVSQLINEKSVKTSEVATQQSVMDTEMISGNGPGTTPPSPGSQTYQDAQTARDKAQERINEIDARIAELEDRRADITRDRSQLTTQNEQWIAQENQRYNNLLAELNIQKGQTADALEQVTKERKEFFANIQAEIGMTYDLEKIADQREKVARLRENSVGSVVTAPVDGTVAELAYVAGQTIQPDETAAVIQIAGKAMTMAVSVTAEQAKSLKTGDEAEPLNSWQYSQFRATLLSVKPDPKEPGAKRELTFTIDSPEVQAGQTVNLKIGEATRTYDMTVPNSAIREDNNGKFILIIEERSSPLRNRYIARRADVDVTASDDTTSAISAALEGWEYVITTATVPIKAGDEVRLASTSY